MAMDGAGTPDEPSDGDIAGEQGDPDDFCRLEAPRDAAVTPGPQAADQPDETAGELLGASVDKAFETYPEDVERGGRIRAYEEQLVLDAPPTFSECPTATRLIATRPIPGQEQQAAEQWTYGGVRVSVSEPAGAGHIGTDFRVDGPDVFQRQHISNPGARRPLPGESETDFVRQLGEQRLGDALAVEALDPETRAEAIRKQTYGEPASPETVAELTQWIDSATPARPK